MTKIAALKAMDLIEANNWPVRIALLVHDEIIFEAGARWAEEHLDCLHEIRHTLETALPLIVPMKSSMSLETRWGSEIDEDKLVDFLDEMELDEAA